MKSHFDNSYDVVLHVTYTPEAVHENDSYTWGLHVVFSQNLIIEPVGIGKYTIEDGSL